MTHNHSLRSSGQVEVPTYSDALIQLDEERLDGSQNIRSQLNANRSNTQIQDGSSQADSEGHQNSSQFINAARSASNKLITELEKLRADKVQYENLIQKLWQELNIKHVQIEQLSNVYEQKAAPKLPDFTGSQDDEKFDIWITRFNEALYKLNSSEKLDQLLPRLRGVAAEFVFDQLNPEVRSDYHALVYELRKRFQAFESPRMYQSQYDKRRQKSGEDVHSFASELKRLYDKAYPGRPRSIRCEDLVRKFFDGLLDEKASTQVEYHKNPASIDQAVYEVIRYMEIIGGSQSTSCSSDVDLN